MTGADTLSRAQAEHRGGNIAAAEPLYRAVLAADPDHAEALYAFGVLLAQTGRLGESLGHLERAARLAPDDGRIGRNFALVLQAAGRLPEAEREFLRLRECEPDQAEHRFGLGLVTSAQGRLAESIGHFRDGLALAPHDAEACCNLGLAYRAAGRLDEAVDAFARAARLAPGLAKAHGNLGGALFAAGRWAEAAEAWKKALVLDPNHPEVEADLGIALANLGRLDEAVQAFERAVRLDPRHPVFHYNLGRALHDMGRLDEACAVYGQVVALDPGHASAHLNRGVILRKQKNYAEAVAAYDRAIALEPGNAHAHLNRSKVLYDMGRHQEALASCRDAIALKPEDAEAHSELAHVRKQLCDWEGLDRDEEKCLSLVRAGAGGVDPFVFLSLSSTQAEQLACARLWAADIAARAKRSPALPAVADGGDAGRIRLGYLSADFRDHPVGYLVANLFERHDRQRFEVFAYSYGPDDGSPTRRRLEQGVDRFVDLRSLTHADAVSRIRRDGIDILVDLTGYTLHSRTDILAARPAPIQVNYLGYAGTLGGDFADYILADPTILPMAEQASVTERIVHLPNCYLPSDPDRAAVPGTPARGACGLPEDGVILCAFHNAYKINPPLFDVWMRVLAQVPGSVLWLLDGSARANLCREAKACGIDPGRLVFAPRVGIGAYLARHRLADLYLDTLPYNAHGSAADALWMGVPVVTCLGRTFPGRVAASVLKAAGLPELVTRTPAQYEELVLALARDSERRAGLRRRLAEAKSASALFDNARFTRDIETAFTRMWQRRVAGKPPESFAV
ncbi:SPY protein [Paramagnetospirillum caucaseum]|uniref:protein O-GlcNAc transferase n=1 Tax=Paramagnetospirillum caucaseum TaxID=1244869 RepID=M2ZR45_9PROT|nr:tetratricopeptide repeat protein [Paramagnetospirillum caucaseum]EME69797.1 SPY protein [Paramagnetospirillum caucaseum]